MSNLKLCGTLDPLLSEAQRIADRRTKALETIHQTEVALSEAERDLVAARERQSREEFEAAQTDGGLAVASKGTQRAVAEAELLVKSIGLRHRGLQPKLGQFNEKLLEVWERIEAHIETVLEKQVSDVSSEFDAAIENLISVTQKAIVLHRHGREQLSKDFFRLHGLGALSVFNPIRVLPGVFSGKPTEVPSSALRAGMLHWRDRLLGPVREHWDGPEARALDGEIRAMRDRVAPLSAVVAALRPKQ